MRTLLIVSPHFPPINAADMQRVRMSLPYFAEFGWKPIVLAVKPEYVEGVDDQLLLESIPGDLAVRHVRALPVRWTRKIGLGDLALRAFPFLYRSGAKIINNLGVDLVYFSTTLFSAMALGRVWKARFGTPFVLDIQDPWYGDYYKSRPERKKPPKYWFAQRLNGVLEPWTMKQVDGLIAVSADYIETLRRRYPHLAGIPCETLAFGASEADFRVVRASPQKNSFFEPGDGNLHGVYVGRGGADMEHALRIIFGALRMGLIETPGLFSRLRLHFIGTDYAPRDRARKTVEPVAQELSVGPYVKEHPHRIPYFETLQLLLEGDFLLVPGSDDSQYTASKIFPYIMAQKPLLCVFHEHSSVVNVMRKTRAGETLTFTSAGSIERSSQELLATWRAMLEAFPYSVKADRAQLNLYSAREMTRRQCELFDRVVDGIKRT